MFAASAFGSFGISVAGKKTGNRKGKDEMRGFFASLRMTIFWEGLEENRQRQMQQQVLRLQRQKRRFRSG